MNKSYGPLDSHVARAGNPSAESSAIDDDLRWDVHDDDVHDDDDIRDDDIRELLPYTTDDRTLVGLGWDHPLSGIERSVQRLLEYSLPPSARSGRG